MQTTGERCSNSMCSPPSASPTTNHQPPQPSTSQPKPRSEEHTSELQSPCNLVCRLLLEKKKYRPDHLITRVKPVSALVPRIVLPSPHALIESPVCRDH